MTCCDHGYGRPSWRPRVSVPATYRSGTPRNQHPAVARWHAHLRGLATAIHEISGLETLLIPHLALRIYHCRLRNESDNRISIQCEMIDAKCEMGNYK